MTEPVMELPQDNPFAQPSTLELEYPRFDLIEDSHYLPAFEVGMREQLEEIETIATVTPPVEIYDPDSTSNRSTMELDLVSHDRGRQKTLWRIL